MNTKIYNGYRLAAGTDIFAFHKKLHDVLDPVCVAVAARALMTQAVRAIDRADVLGEDRPTGTSLLPDACTELLNESEREYARADRAPHQGHPFYFRVCFGQDPHTGRIHALVYTIEDEFTKAWEGIGEVEEYGYWNNTDRPAHVTDDEWSQRREAWDRVLPGWEPPATAMLTFNLTTTDIGGATLPLIHLTAGRDKRHDLLTSQAPTISQRATSLALDTLFRAARTIAEENQVELTVDTAYDIFAIDRGAVIEALHAVLDPDAARYAIDTTEMPGRTADPGGVAHVHALARAAVTPLFQQTTGAES